MRLLGYARKAGSHDALTQFEALIAAGVDPQDLYLDDSSEIEKGSSERPGMRHLLEAARRVTLSSCGGSIASAFRSVRFLER